MPNNKKGKGKTSKRGKMTPKETGRNSASVDKDAAMVANVNSNHAMELSASNKGVVIEKQNVDRKI